MTVTISTDFVAEIARAVRVNVTVASTEELTALIQAGAADLARQGVRTVALSDPLTKQAIKLYCKGNYGYDDTDHAERFQKCYEALSASMALDMTDYGDGDADAV